MANMRVHRFRETDQLWTIPSVPPYVVEAGGFNAVDRYHGSSSESG
jgi:hypothetical protein